MADRYLVVTSGDRRQSPRSTGAILTVRRQRQGFSLQQLADADGEWSPEQVRTLEQRRTWPTSLTARYVRALERLERGAEPGPGALRPAGAD